MFEVWIDARVLKLIEAEASSFYPLETGGILVGYRTGNAQVIAHMLPAGPNAMRAPDKFEPDHEWQCDQLDLIYEESKRSMIYLGDWHTHPNGRAGMSSEDRRTLKRIAQSKSASAPNPMMLIGAGSPSAWHWLVHVYSGCRLLGFAVDVATREPIQFDRLSTSTP